MTREESIKWLDVEIRTWESECQSKHPIKEALHAARKALEQEPCEDAVSRKSVITIIQNHWWNCRDIDKLVNELPPVTPQEPNTWSLDDAREDFKHDVYNELDFLPTNEEANRIIDIFDRVTNSIEQEPKWIPVTERLPEEEGFYLVTRRITDDVATFIFRRTPTSKDYWKRCVTAWMPLPKPYEGGQEDGNDD